MFDLPLPLELAPQFAADAYVICEDVVAPARAGELRGRALRIAASRASRIDRTSGEHLLRYRVVTGDAVAAEWPELFGVYQSSELSRWVTAVTGAQALRPSSHVRSAININVMGEPGETYRWHTDAAGFTLLLYLSDSREEDGGALEMRLPENDRETKWMPLGGALVLMDGTRCLHRVAPIVRRHERISIPMVFVREDDDRRPQALDGYIYGTR